MPLKLMYITNKPDIAKIAENHGVDIIFVDLELIGKEERQKLRNTVISRHVISDVNNIKQVLNRAKLLVRVNPIHSSSKDEIEQAIQAGADIVMLPYFKTRTEVELFIQSINGRAETCLLCETPEAVEDIQNILSVSGIDSIHIGLNDLHIGYNMTFMFEPLIDGTVDQLCNLIKAKDMPFGFGGIAQIGMGDLPAEYIIAEHYRLGSSMAILSRSFYNSEANSAVEAERIFREGIRRIRDYEQFVMHQGNEFFSRNHETVTEIVEDIVRKKKAMIQLEQ